MRTLFCFIYIEQNDIYFQIKLHIYDEEHRTFRTPKYINTKIKLKELAKFGNILQL